MNPLQERLNAQLEQFGSRPGAHLSGCFPLEATDKHDLEIEELVTLANDLRAASQLQIHPDFARHMKRRLLRHVRAFRRQKKFPSAPENRASDGEP